MKFSLFGAGRIGSLHARILADTVGGDSVLVADVDEARAEAVARDVGARAVSVEAALDEGDALVIASSTSTHAELLEAGAARGKPIFCEKPLAVDLPSTVRVVENLEKAGIPVQLGFQRRFDPAYLEARRMIESEEIGTVYCIRLAGHDPAPPHEAYIPVSGGLFRDFSIHDFDVIRWLVDADGDEVYADGGVRGFEVFARYGDIDTGVLTLRMTNGVLAVLTTSRHDPRGYDIRTEIFGSRDSIAVGLGPRTPIRSVEPGVAAPDQPGWDGFAARFATAYRAEIAEFVRVARGEASSRCPAREGLEALLIAEAATRSLHEHRPVKIGEFRA